MITVEEHVIESEQAQEKLNESFKESRPRIPGVLSNLKGIWEVNGIPVSAIVPHNPRYVYVQMYGDGTPVEVLSRRGVPTYGGIPVVVGWAEDSYEREVLEVHTGSLPPNYSGPVIHVGDDPDDDFVYPDQVTWLKTSAVGGLDISVSTFIYYYQGQTVTFNGLNRYDMTPHIPGAGLVRYVGVYLDPTTNTIAFVNGSTIPNVGVDLPPFPNFPEQTWPSAFVLLANGVTEIDPSTLNVLVNARQLAVWVEPTGGGGAGGWPSDNKAMINTTEYATIETAYTAASPGDTIKLGPGEFNVGGTLLNLAKANLKLKGTGRESTKITGDILGATVSVTADGVILEDLHVENIGSGALCFGVGLNTASTTARLNRVKVTCPNNATNQYGVYVTNGTHHLDDVISTVSTNQTGYGLYASGGNSVVYVRDGEYSGDDADIGSLINTTIKMSGPRLVNDRLVGGNNQGYWVGTGAYGPARVNGVSPVVNIAYNSLTYDLFSRYQLYTDIPNDTYFSDGWVVIHNASSPNQPDCGRQIAASTDPFTHYLRVQNKVASGQFGLVHPFWHSDLRPYRDQPISLSADLWGQSIVNIRAAIIYWTGGADSINTSVVGTWGTGNPTLASNWFYATAPTASQAISSTRLRLTFPNFTVPNTATNMAIFIWTPDLQNIGDYLNVARVQLEPGVVSTTYRPRLQADEEFIMQSMVQKSYNRGTVPGTAIVLSVIERETRTAVPASTAGVLRFTHNWVPKMRSTPTVILYAYSDGEANAVNITGGLKRTGCTAEIATLGDGRMAAITVDASSGQAIALDDLIVFHYYAEALL